MRRWNGWGDDTFEYVLPALAARFLQERAGAGTPPPDATLDEVMATVPAARLPSHSLVSVDAEERLRHARGQSLPDWLALRMGVIGAFPDGVAYPTTEADVKDLLRYAQAVGAHLIPYGGGTSVVGHINPLPGDVPVLTVDMSRMSSLQEWDEASHLATFGAGVTGPNLEAQLRARGCTLGHFPQSFEYSTLGGWIVTRSSGQQALGYGRIGDLFAGGRLVAPAGMLELPGAGSRFPASAAGPDLREMVLGSEGRLGLLTEATVRATPLPQREDFHAVFFPDFERAMTATRQISQACLPLSMLRLSTPAETETTLALAGHEMLIGALEQLLALRGVKDAKCMLLLGLTGRDGLVRAARHEALGIAGKHGGIHVGRTFGRQWHKSRFTTPYLRNALWEAGYAIDTLETATDWANVSKLVDAIETALRGALGDMGERIHVFTHLSRLYPYGSSIYTTYLFRVAADADRRKTADETLRRWQLLKSAASQVILAHGGTISHQHGVGLDHLPYLSAEKGPLGMATIQTMCRQFDPDGMMNPGKLVTT